MTTFQDIQNELRVNDPAKYIALEIISEIAVTRADKKLTQNELSLLTGLPQKTISRIENGLDTPTFKTLGILMKALGIKPKISFE